MATFLPPQYPPRESFPLTSSSPPEKYMSNVTQHDRFARDPSGPIESRANGVPAYGNTNGSMPVPNAPLAFTNGDTPHRMGALPFNTARSPPNAKSRSFRLTAERESSLTASFQALRMSPASSSALANVKLEKHAPFPIRLISHPPTLPANTSPRYVNASRPLLIPLHLLKCSCG